MSTSNFVSRLKRRLHQQWHAYGLKRDLTRPGPRPTAVITLDVREFRPDDLPFLFPEDKAVLTPDERRELNVRRRHLEADIPQCYVAVDVETGRPCYMQWAMGSEQNDHIQSFFRGRFPILGEGEVLLENAYTPAEYRGKGIMPAAMSMIAERVAQRGAKNAITFVLRDNVPSLKGCKKAGFDPYLTRRDTHLFFHLFKFRKFEGLPAGTLLPYERSTKS